MIPYIVEDVMLSRSPRVSKWVLGQYPPGRVGVICNCNIKINSNLPFFNVIASIQLLSG